jgi:hypothetical protein
MKNTRSTNQKNDVTRRSVKPAARKNATQPGILAATGPGTIGTTATSVSKRTTRAKQTGIHVQSGTAMVGTTAAGKTRRGR